MRRQEKFSSPDDVHDPHRLVVSRRVILRRGRQDGRRGARRRPQDRGAPGAPENRGSAARRSRPRSSRKAAARCSSQRNPPRIGSRQRPVQRVDGRSCAERRATAAKHRLKAERLRRPAQPGADPGRLLFGKAFCVDEFCARRNRQHEILRRLAKSQYEAARGGRAFEFDPIGFARLRNVEMRDLGNPGRTFPIKRARSLATGFGARYLSRKGISFALTRPLAILVQLRPLAFRHEC